jgi:anaerobic ribonucleoside-triphosphate reductase activating protein
MMNKSVTPQLIQVAMHLSESNSNGPGCRSVLWVQGCSKRCPNCWNPDFLPFTGGQAWTIAEAVEQLTASSAIEGVTFLGGEPFAQAAALATLAQELQQRGLGVMAYSGWTRAELERMGAPQTNLLAHCDLLVDGEYDPTQQAPLLWRGSANQQVHFLTPRYQAWRAGVDQHHRDFEILIEGDRLILTGDPPAEIYQLLPQLLPQIPSR